MDSGFLTLWGFLVHVIPATIPPRSAKHSHPHARGAVAAGRQVQDICILAVDAICTGYRGRKIDLFGTGGGDVEILPGRIVHVIPATIPPRSAKERRPVLLIR